MQIYKYEPNLSDWTLLDILDQHGLLVTGIDWAPNTNRIVTCSAVSFLLNVSIFYLLIIILLLLLNRIVMHMYGQLMTRENGNQLLYY